MEGKVNSAINSNFLHPFKHRTIVSLSIVYTIGQVVTALSSINDLSDFNHDGTPDNLSVHVWVDVNCCPSPTLLLGAYLVLWFFIFSPKLHCKCKEPFLRQQQQTEGSLIDWVGAYACHHPNSFLESLLTWRPVVWGSSHRMHGQCLGYCVHLDLL